MSSKTNDRKTISQKLSTTPGSFKSSSTRSKVLSENTSNQLTAQVITNVLPHKTTCQKILSHQIHWKGILCRKKCIVYGSSTVEQLLRFFTLLFNHMGYLTAFWFPQKMQSHGLLV